MGAGQGLPWKELLGLGTGPSIQPAPTLELSRQREWGSDPHAQASGIFGRRGRPVFLRHRLAPSAALPLSSGLRFPCLRLGATAAVPPASW